MGATKGLPFLLPRSIKGNHRNLVNTKGKNSCFYSTSIEGCDFVAELERKSLLRTSLIIGSRALEKLAKSRVIVCGLGGVGGSAAEALARSGIGFIKLIDGDVIDVTNLNRQLIATLDNIGNYKVIEMEKRLKSVAKKVILEPLKVMLTPENLRDYIKDTDYVVDCIDDVPTKTALIFFCLENQIPIVSAMGAGGRLDPSLIRIGDISETKIDPLSKVMRKRLRDNGVRSGLQVVYSLETPVKAKEVEGKMIIGSSSFVPPAFGLSLASVVVKGLVGTVEQS